MTQSLQDLITIIRSVSLVIIVESSMSRSSLQHIPFLISTCVHTRLGDNFYVVNDKNYCVQHREASLQHCSVCQQVISEGGLLINNAFYHLDCFKCSKCQQILDGTYYSTDSGFLCKHDFMVCDKDTGPLSFSSVTVSGESCQVCSLSAAHQ